MERFQKTADKWEKVEKQLNDDCVDFLTRVLKEHDNSIDWSEMADIDEVVYVTYDGGNHPVYGSIAFFMVQAVQMDEDGNITLNCGDDLEYGIDRLITHELYAVCDFIDIHILPEIEKK